MNDTLPPDAEETHLPYDSKHWRKERKRVRLADRSQTKKSDRDQRTKNKRLQSNPRQLPVGRVLSVTAQGYEVDAEGTSLLCVLRRTHLQTKRNAKGLITVGDLVLYSILSPGEGVIEEICERYSVLTRADSLSARHRQLIAANVDQVIVTASVGAPTLKPALIDRYLIAASKGHMQAVILINKVDLLPFSEIAPTLELYRSLGYTSLAVSTQTGQGIAELKQVMKDKASVFAGQSGVGKSSLINAITGLTLAVGNVVTKTRKGSHTTTQSRLIRLPSGGWCVDTPGIKSFGMWELNPHEVAIFFQEIERARALCRFPNCSHTHEPDCAVISAVERGEISPLRYESYLTLLQETTSDRHKRR